MRARPKAKGKLYYYYDMGGKPRKERPLGCDYILALQEWAKLEQVASIAKPTFNDAADRYLIDELPHKAPRSQQDNLKELPNLREFFGDGLLDEIEPVHINQFMAWRVKKARDWLRKHGKSIDKESGHVRANRERALFSHIFNYARGKGLTAATNPCLGIETLDESGRDVYVEDSTYKIVWDAAREPLRDAMDLAYLTGQRPADTVSMTERDIKDGHLHVKQGKTGKKIRIAVEGDLAAVIERIRARRRGHKVVTMHLVINQYGRPVSRRTVAAWLRDVRKATGIDPDSFKFMDLRAKAGTDKDDAQGMIAAQNQLGHTTPKTTARYVRNRLGKKVSPTR
ncbi:tyrosine-type recombinase/integrase [Candidimonas humi]|uniref:Tyrosine-type recombinase/integrase n=1 Tax=Candidimonas humi TaxID=683355 RepID=A0ABV8NW43_9BURK|nr:tyrosine-type recombinase/integrase [Candidimonas humi]